MITETHAKVLKLGAVFGIEARVTTPSEMTGGEYVEMDCTLLPGGGTTIHYHPEQEESYQILEGTMEVFHHGEWHVVTTGEKLTVQKSEVHGFRNTGDRPVQFLNVHRPVLGFQKHLETLDLLVREGKIKGLKDPRSLMYMSMSSVKYRPDVTVKPPQRVINFIAFLGHRLGFKLPSL